MKEQEDGDSLNIGAIIATMYVKLIIMFSEHLLYILQMSGCEERLYHWREQDRVCGLFANFIYL